MIIGIDPGKNTGIAIFEDYKLVDLISTNTYGLIVFLQENKDKIEFAVVENSKGQKKTFNLTKIYTKAAAAGKGRRVGENDGKVAVITETCEALKIQLETITPLGKGSKVKKEPFKIIFPYYKQPATRKKTINEHERDAAMCAYKLLYHKRV